jgi:hypothetical protein
MESRRSQKPVEQRHLLCPTCGEPLVIDAAEFGPVDSNKPDHVVDGRPYCPNGHDAADVGGEG